VTDNALPGRTGLSDDAALIVAATPAGLYSLDVEGRATLVNPAAVRLLGWSAADLVGRRLHDVIHHTREDGREYPIDVCPVYLSAKDGQPRRSDAEVYWRKDGTSVPVEVECHPVVIEGVRSGVLVSFRDISERRDGERRTQQLVQEQAARAYAEFQHAQLRDALGQAPALICVTRGPRHVIESANDRYVEAAGRPDLIGLAVAEAFPDAPPERLAMLDRAFTSGAPVAAQESAAVLFGLQEPDERLYNFVIQPLRDDTGSVYGLMTHAVDVSDQVRGRRALVAQHRMARLLAQVGLVLTRAESLRESLQACAEVVVEHASAALARIWTLDAAGQVLELQASAGLYTHLNGAHGRVPVGQFKIGLIAQERTPHFTNNVADDPRVGDHAWARRERIVAFAGYPLLAGDQLLGVLAMFARHPLSDADLQALGAVASGLSVGIQRKRNEEALRRSEHDLRRRASELTRVAAALERSNRELDAFAYAASHDLRAPLRGIANLAQWLEEDLQPHLSDETRQMLALMRARMQRMEAIVEGLLQYSRAGRVHHEVEEVDVAALTREVVDLLSPPAGALIEIAPGLPTLRTERVPLQQVLMNLIGNALKHAGRDDPRVTIAALDSGDFYELSVADNGPGIEAQFHDRIWGIFQTLQSRDTVEGTGIGLALVKKLVEAQGGRVRVESSPGAGATFLFLWRKVKADDD
jgi:PAS domain S-box-containing protein